MPEKFTVHSGLIYYECWGGASDSNLKSTKVIMCLPCAVYGQGSCVLRKVSFFFCLVAEVRKSDVRETEEEDAWCGAWLLAGGWENTSL